MADPPRRLGASTGVAVPGVAVPGWSCPECAVRRDARCRCAPPPRTPTCEPWLDDLAADERTPRPPRQTATASHTARRRNEASAAAGACMPSAIAAERHESHQPMWCSASGVHWSITSARRHGSQPVPPAQVESFELLHAPRDSAASRAARRPTHGCRPAPAPSPAPLPAIYSSCATPAAGCSRDTLSGVPYAHSGLHCGSIDRLRGHHPPGFGAWQPVYARMPR